MIIYARKCQINVSNTSLNNNNGKAVFLFSEKYCILKQRKHIGKRWCIQCIILIKTRTTIINKILSHNYAQVELNYQDRTSWTPHKTPTACKSKGHSQPYRAQLKYSMRLGFSIACLLLFMLHETNVSFKSTRKFLHSDYTFLKHKSWEGMEAYDMTWFNYTYPLLIVTLMIAIIIMSKYSSRFANFIGKRN